MTYSAALRYLNSLTNYEQKSNYPYQVSFDLKRLKVFLQLLGNPQDSLKCLHIAGTKAKGSVCVFIAYILKEAGYKVGLYTSPHLIDIRERIRILKSHRVTALSQHQSDFEGMISKKAITHLVERVKPVIEKYQRISKSGNLTFFEVYTALAFVYFREQKVDYTVLETGLGGRLDATNTVNPLVCGITPISYDHMAQLGSTLRQIAKEKSGIIKSHHVIKSQGSRLIVISSPQEKEAREVIQERCRKTGAGLYEAGKDICWQKQGINPRSQRFSVKGIKEIYSNLKIRLVGQHQLDNVCVAIGMVEALDDKSITPTAIRRGLRMAVWPGRCEVIAKKPFIVLDGAQNASSAATLTQAVKTYFTYQKLILILGISSDKNISGICDMLCPLADTIILTKSKNPRAADPVVIKNKIAVPVILTYKVKDALSNAKKMASPKDLILVSGSLFVVGETRNIA